jgi:hypothetical protein
LKRAIAAAVLLTLSARVHADPAEARAQLLTLPHADIGRLLGSWQVKEMEPITMIYEFQSETMSMHGLNGRGGASFEMTMDADYRRAGQQAIWVIGTHPRPAADAADGGGPSILAIEFTGDDQATMTVSADEHFTLVKVP